MSSARAIVAGGNAHERHQVEPAAERELRFHRLEADAGVLHVEQDEFGAGLAADRRIAWCEELERHGAERAAAGREPRLQWIWAQRISPEVFLGQDSRIVGAATGLNVSIGENLRKVSGPINPGL